MKAFVARITYFSEELGNLDVEFHVDGWDEVKVLIDNGPGIDALVDVQMTRPVFLLPAKTPASIESLVQQVLLIDEEAFQTSENDRKEGIE